MTICEQCGEETPHNRKKVFRPNQMMVCRECFKQDYKLISIEKLENQMKIFNEELQKMYDEQKQLEMKKRALEHENKKLKEKKKFPYWIKVKGTCFNVTEPYLKTILKQITPISDVVQVDYGSN